MSSGEGTIGERSCWVGPALLHLWMEMANVRCLWDCGIVIALFKIWNILYKENDILYEAEVCMHYFAEDTEYSHSLHFFPLNFPWSFHMVCLMLLIYLEEIHKDSWWHTILISVQTGLCAVCSPMVIFIIFINECTVFLYQCLLFVVDRHWLPGWQSSLCEGPQVLTIRW